MGQMVEGSAQLNVTFPQEAPLFLYLCNLLKSWMLYVWILFERSPKWGHSLYWLMVEKCRKGPRATGAQTGKLLPALPTLLAEIRDFHGPWVRSHLDKLIWISTARERPHWYPYRIRIFLLIEQKYNCVEGFTLVKYSICFKKFLW